MSKLGYIVLGSSLTVNLIVILGLKGMANAKLEAAKKEETPKEE